MPVWAGRISPVFDVAGRLLLVDFDNGVEVGREEEALDQRDPSGRVRRLAQLGPDVLICGAISRPLELMLMAAGVQVIPQTCGPVDAVLQAFATGRMDPQTFLMPGCFGRRRGRRHGQARRAT